MLGSTTVRLINKTVAAIMTNSSAKPESSPGPPTELRRDGQINGLVNGGIFNCNHRGCYFDDLVSSPDGITLVDYENLVLIRNHCFFDSSLTLGVAHGFQGHRGRRRRLRRRRWSDPVRTRPGLAVSRHELEGVPAQPWERAVFEFLQQVQLYDGIVTGQLIRYFLLSGGGLGGLESGCLGAGGSRRPGTCVPGVPPANVQHEVYGQGERHHAQNARAPFLNVSSCLHGVKYRSAASRNSKAGVSPAVMLKLRITIKSLAVSRACANFSRPGKGPSTTITSPRRCSGPEALLSNL